MASKRCSSIKLLSLTFVSKSISKSLLIDIYIHLYNCMQIMNVNECNGKNIFINLSP